MNNSTKSKFFLGFIGALSSFSFGAAQTIGPVVVTPPSVVAVYPELGTGVVVATPQPAPTPYQPGSGYGYGSGGGTPMGGSAMAAYEASGFASSGLAAANQLGLNGQAIAGFAYAESHDQNIPVANGSTSAFGVYQITLPTWDATVSQNNLPFTEADRSNPADQAVVAAYIMRDCAQSLSAAIGTAPTVDQTYGSYVFGSGPGDVMASSPLSEPLSQIVSPQAIANNNMQGWTVGQFYSTMASRLGGTAGASVYS